jgi:hypothetical protein
MLSKIYFYFKDRSKRAEDRVFELVKNNQLCDNQKSSKLFSHNLVFQNILLVFFEILADLIKFSIILSADSGHGFNTIFRQRELKSCPYSYQSYRNAQKRIRIFSAGGVAVLVIVSVASSLITNLVFGPKSPSKAASFGWVQTSWSAQSTSTANFQDNQTGWDNYSVKSDTILQMNGGASLGLAVVSSTVIVASDIDFSAGMRNSTEIVGSGTGASIQLASIASGTWSTLADMPNSSYSGFYVSDGSRYIYAIRGMVDFGASAEFWRYDMASNIWTSLTDMPGGSANGALAYDGADTIYARQGQASSDQGSVTSAFWKYSISAGTWSSLTNLPDVGLSGGLVYDGNGHLFADQAYESSPGSMTDIFWKYTIDTDTWEAVAPLPVAGGMSSFVYDGNGHIFGTNWEASFDNGNGTGTFWRYDIAGNSWSPMANSPHDTYDGTLVYDGHGHILGAQSVGTNDGGWHNAKDFWQYDIASNSWTRLPDTPDFTSRGSIASDEAGNIYLNRGLGNDGVPSINFWRYNAADGFPKTGMYVSPVYDAGQKIKSLTLSFNATQSSSTSVQFNILAGNTASQDESWDRYDNVQDGVEQADLARHRYFKYEAVLKTDDPASTPVIDDIALSYDYYQVPRAPIDDAANFLGYWKMDNNWLDSKSGNNGSRQGSGQSFGTDEVGRIYGRFNGPGTNDGLLVRPVLQNRSNWTWEGWVYSDAYSGHIYTEGNPATMFQLYIEPSEDNNIFVGAWNPELPGNWMFATSSAKLSTSTWHHIALVLSDGAVGTGTLKFYVDGQFSNAAPFQNGSYLSDYATIGNNCRHSYWGDVGDGAFNGHLDKLAIFDRALSAAEIADHYNEGRDEPTETSQIQLTSSWYDTGSVDSFFVGLGWTEDPQLAAGTNVKFQVRSSNAATSSELASSTEGLVSRWRLDNDWSDSMGINALSDASASFGAAKYGAAAGSFDGATYARTPASALGLPTGSDSRTISAWVYRNPGDARNGVGFVALMGAEAEYRSFGLGIANDMSVYVAAWAHDLYTTEKINYSEWTHIVVTYQGGQSLIDGVKIYINGSLAHIAGNVGDTSVIVNSAPDMPFKIGSAAIAGYGFNGLIDDVAVYNRVLPPQEVLSLYVNGIPAILTTGFVGPDGTSKTYFTSADAGCDPKDENAGTVNCRFLPPAGVVLNNRWFQYRAILETDGAASPQLDQLTFNYLINKKPEFDRSFGIDGIELEQQPLVPGEDSSRVTIRYRVRDADTSQGSVTAGFITPAFEYFDPFSQIWTPISDGNLKPGDLDNKAVQGDEFTSYSASLMASSLNFSNGEPFGNLKIRVKLNDNEPVNNLAQADAEVFYDGVAPTTNLQPLENFKQFLNHEFMVPEHETRFMSDRFTGNRATATDALYGDRTSNRNFRPHLIFNGTSTKVELPPLVDLSKDQPFSIYWTTHMDFQGGGCRPMLSTAGTPNNITVCVDSQDGVSNVVHLIGPGGDFWGTTPIGGDDRYSFHLIYDGTNIRLYFNGSLEINQPFNYPFGQENVSWTLGYSDSNDHYFKGKIGFVASWRKAMPLYFPNSNFYYFDVFSTSQPRMKPAVDDGLLQLGLIDFQNTSYSVSNKNYGEADGLNDISGSWQDTASSSYKAVIPWKFTDNSSRDVYLRTRDTYGNIGDEAISIPYAPTKLDLKDLSNVKDDTNKEYISWQVSDLSTLNYASNYDFIDYIIYRSIDGTNYAPIGYVDDRLQNYYSDTDVEKGKKYYYRVSVQLYNGVESEKSTVVSDKADGQGGTDFTPPSISSTTVMTTDSTWARITWSTDELANSVVEYSEKSADSYASTTRSISMVTSHEVVINNLKPDTDYVFRVKSTDPLNNEGEDNNGNNGYGFKTKNGPSITNVSTIQAANYSAKIAWTTSEPAQGSIIYSLNQSFASPVTVQEGASATAHELELTGLTPGETYYYKVTAKNAAEVESLDDNDGRFYQFTAANDMEPPIISRVGADPKTGTETMIDWRTNEPATSRVFFGTEPGKYTASTSLNSDLVTVHVSELYGLASQQQYYYVVVSSDGSGNTSTSSERSFLSIEPVVVESAVKARESAAATKAKAEMTSGVTVINKTDTTAPNLSRIKVEGISGNSAVINWLSDEVADSFVEYGTTDKYGEIYGSFENKTEHKVKLNHLLADATYHFRVAGKDANGNLAKSDDQTFKTAKTGSATEQTVEEIISGKQDKGELAAKTPEEKNKLVSQAIERAVSLLNQFSGDVTLGTLESSMMTQYDALNKLAILVPAPVLSAEPAVNVSANSASIQWQTNKEATSFVAYGPAEVYDLQKNQNGYNQIVGNPDSYSLSHQVTLAGLKPQTVYHYQVKSKAKIGAEAVSRDFTFKTKEESLDITYYSLDRLSPTSASLKWVTNMPADSGLSYIPYRANKLSVEEEKTLSDKHLSTVHELVINDFETGVIYQIEAQSTDAKGKKITKQIPAFSTTKDDLPPEITQVQTESMISQAKDAKVQTIITWMTNEPTLCQLTYDKGVISNDKIELRNKITVESGYSRKHTAVVTNFEPGTVYSLQITATDSGGNTSKSPVRTIITPRQKETVFDLIVNNFKETFGWVDKIKGLGN